jgi:cob(I)alamin adenosyltransferase
LSAVIGAPRTTPASRRSAPSTRPIAPSGWRGCTRRDEKLDYEPLRIVAAQVDWLETEIDRLNADLEPLKSFVLPAGSPLATHLHLARTIARRAERAMVTLAAKETINPEALRYINRVSDFLFVAARHANDKGAGDVLWVPGKNR